MGLREWWRKTFNPPTPPGVPESLDLVTPASAKTGEQPDGVGPGDDIEVATEDGDDVLDVDGAVK